jgi:hypothetical protein
MLCTGYRGRPLAASFELALDVEFNKKLNELFTKERGFVTLLLRFMVRFSEIQQVLVKLRKSFL